MAWNDLTPAQQAAWKKKNFNPNIKVSEATIQKLRDGKTKSANIKKYAGTNNKQIREAMNRFYGKGWDKGAKPKTGGSKYKPGPVNDRPNASDVPMRTIRSIEGSAGYSAPKKGKGNGKAKGGYGLNALTGYRKPGAATPTLQQAEFMRKEAKKGKKYSSNTSAAERAAMATMFIPGVGLVARSAIMGTKAATAGARAALGAKVFANARGLGSGSRAAAATRAAAEQAARRSAAAKAAAATRAANKAAAAKAAAAAAKKGAKQVGKGKAVI